jgi:hypothetical protein
MTWNANNTNNDYEYYDPSMHCLITSSIPVTLQHLNATGLPSESGPPVESNVSAYYHQDWVLDPQLIADGRSTTLQMGGSWPRSHDPTGQGDFLSGSPVIFTSEVMPTQEAGGSSAQGLFDQEPKISQQVLDSETTKQAFRSCKRCMVYGKPCMFEIPRVKPFPLNT